MFNNTSLELQKKFSDTYQNIKAKESGKDLVHALLQIKSLFLNSQNLFNWKNLPKQLDIGIYFFKKPIYKCSKYHYRPIIFPKRINQQRPPLLYSKRFRITSEKTSYSPLNFLDRFHLLIKDQNKCTKNFALCFENDTLEWKEVDKQKITLVHKYFDRKKNSQNNVISEKKALKQTTNTLNHLLSRWIFCLPNENENFLNDFKIPKICEIYTFLIQNIYCKKILSDNKELRKKFFAQLDFAYHYQLEKDIHAFQTFFKEYFKQLKKIEEFVWIDQMDVLFTQSETPFEKLKKGVISDNSIKRNLQSLYLENYFFNDEQRKNYLLKLAENPIRIIFDPSLSYRTLEQILKDSSKTIENLIISHRKMQKNPKKFISHLKQLKKNEDSNEEYTRIEEALENYHNFDYLHSFPVILKSQVDEFLVACNETKKTLFCLCERCIGILNRIKNNEKSSLDDLKSKLNDLKQSSIPFSDILQSIRKIINELNLIAENLK